MTDRDELTGLANRGALLRWLETPEDDSAGAPIVLAAVDLEHFAGINIEYGEERGDAVLREIAGRLPVLAGPTGVAARVGGDAFLVARRGDGAAPVELGHAVLEAVRHPVEVDGAPVVVTGKVAVAEGEPDEAVASLIRRLEVALGRVRRTPGQTVAVAGSHEPDSGRVRLAADVVGAVERDEIRVHYLPIVGLADGAIVGVEALARWHRDGEVLEAKAFLDAAQKTGAIVPIGRYVMERACTEVAAWNAAHEGRPLRVSVNASLHHLLDPDAVRQVAAYLARSGLEPSRLCIELREDALNELGEGVTPTLEGLKDLGVRLSVDDFGTGASSLVALQRHRVDELKVDRSFVARMDLDPSAAAVVRGITLLAGSLDLEVVAEGVERPAQEQMLRSLRCDAAQGWLYARPGERLADVVADADAAAARSLARRPAEHQELWAGLPSATAAARFVEAVFETAPIGMVLVDDAGRMLAANPAAASLLGHPVADLLQRTCWEGIHPGDLQAELSQMDRLLRGECTSYVVEERAVAADGSSHWVEVTVSGVPGDSQARGNPTRLLRQVRSIAEARRAGEDAAVLRSIIAASPDALLITDDRGRCTLWNRAAEQLFGWREEEMVGSSLNQLVGPADQMALARVIAEASAGAAVRWPDATWIAASGDPRAVDVTLGPIHDADGGLIGLVALARDDTDQRAAHQALHDAHQALEAHVGELGLVNDRLASFASALTHDLLQPVAALDGFLGLLERHATEITADHREWLEGALRGKRRVVDAITALHRAATQDDVDLEPVSLATVVATVADDVASGSVPLQVRTGQLPIVLGDRDLLTQVLTNLLQNSLRYRDDRPLEIEVTAVAEGPDWSVAVVDNGLGIDPDELETVFERGVRGSASASTQGTGTGLATVRSLMRRMDGDAWAEANGGGARICLRLRGAAQPAFH